MIKIVAAIVFLSLAGQAFAEEKGFREALQEAMDAATEQDMQELQDDVEELERTQRRIIAEGAADVRVIVSVGWEMVIVVALIVAGSVSTAAIVGSG